MSCRASNIFAICSGRLMPAFGDAMGSEQKPKKKKRRLLGLFLSLIPLAILTYFAVSLISGQGLGISRIIGFFSASTSTLTVDVLEFNVGHDIVYADLDDSVVAAGTLGIQIFSSVGKETLRDPLRMSSPALCTGSGSAVVFDIGGTAARVFSKTEIITSHETDTPIISASINNNGYHCVTTQGTGGYKGRTMVFNSKGKELYKVDLASGYILTAIVSPDNKTLAILEMVEGGSRIAFYSIDSEAPGSSFDLPDTLIIDIIFIQTGDVLAVSEDSLLVVNPTGGTGDEIYTYKNRLLSGYTYDGGFIALHLLDYGIGYSGRIVTISENGKILGEIMTDKDILSVSSRGGDLAVLRSDGVFIYTGILEEFKALGPPVSAAEAMSILAIGGGVSLVAGDYSAVVYRAVVERSDGH